MNKIPLTIGNSPLRVAPGINNSNQVSLGLQNQYWKEVWSGKYKIPNGTSSQFLKADGSVDSTSYATLDSTGKVPTSQLPSYVDDVDEYTNRASFPATGEKGKIYVDTTENDIYRWTGSTYIKISGIIGAQGEKGAQGYTGLQGATGLQGKQGLQGKNGTNGTNGTNGVQGYRGYQGLQGISGALATNHWYLDKANPEVTNNGSSKIIQLDNSSDSIFAKLSNLTNGPLNGRNFIVDLADSDGNAMINNLFGDFSKINVPNHVRYHFYIRNLSKRQSPMKLNWDPSFYTNVPHRDGYAQQVVLNYGECCKIEFVKFDQTYSWVDVELEDIVYNTSTAAASENNEDNAMSQIMNYCDNNKLSYVLDKESNNLSFNLIDIIADICSKLK